MRHAVIGALVIAGIVALSVVVGHRQPEPVGRAAILGSVIAEVEAGRSSTPILGDQTDGGNRVVTFLARRDGDRVPRIVSDVTGWGEHLDGTFDFNAGAMTPVGGSDWYALETRVAPGARIEYLIAYGAGDYRLDPHNARPGLEQPPASEFVMPEYVPPEEFSGRPVSAAGRVAETVFDSNALGRECRLAVYTPPGYRRDGAYPLAVFPDRPSGPVPRVLDWLIARGAIEPIVAVFAETYVRGAASVPAEEMRAFLTRELPAWLAPRYGVTRSADRRAIIGISFSAKDALDAALAPAGTFGRLGMLIPGRRITRTDIDGVASQHPRRLRVAILAGRYDSANRATAQGVRRALADAGHLVDYMEVPEGHTPRTWRNHLREVLVSLFGPLSAGERR